MKIRETFCRICEPACPMRARYGASGKLERLLPDPDHPSGSVACHKGLSFLEIHNDPDRLDWPLKRRNPRTESKGDFQAISWEDSFAEIGERLRSIREKYGPDSIALFYGNTILGDSRGFFAVSQLMNLSGSRMLFNANSQDAANKTRGCAEIYGSPAFLAPDLTNTQYLLCIGANPKISRWTGVSIRNDALEALKAIRRRGGKVCFVNPRRTESSTPETGETLRIKPGTDVYFLASLMNEIHRRNGFDHEVIGKYGKNVQGLIDFVTIYPPEKVAPVTGLSAEEIKQVASDLLAAESAIVYSGTGLNQSRQGLLAYWLAEMVNFVTGNMGRNGGTFSPNGYFTEKTPVDLDGLKPFATSVGDLMPPPGEFLPQPAVLLPDLIKGGDVKALVTFYTNPMLSVGGETKLREALPDLDLMVCVDVYRSATAEMSDYVLAATDWLEREDINYFLAMGYQPQTPYVQYSDAMDTPAPGRRHDWWIVSRIAQEMGLASILDDPDSAQDGFAPVNALLAASNLSIDKLRTMPRQTAVFEQSSKDAVFERNLVREDGKVDCCPSNFSEAGLFERCSEIFGELVNEPEGVLKLISLRTNHMHNSWLVNSRKIRQDAVAENPLYISSMDADRLGLFDGDMVSVFNENGRIKARLRISDEFRPGVVAMTHGCGNSKSHGLRFAQAHPGVNCNQLMPTSKDSVEPLSNMSWLSGVPVQVARVA